MRLKLTYFPEFTLPVSFPVGLISVEHGSASPRFDAKFLFPVVQVLFSCNFLYSILPVTLYNDLFPFFFSNLHYWFSPPPLAVSFLEFVFFFFVSCSI